MIVRAGILAVRRAHEGQVLDARDIGRVGAVQIAPRKAGLIEGQKTLGRDQLALDASALRVAAVAPMDAVGLGQPGDLIHPGRHVVIQGS
jgi:hypothetical protein